MGRCRTPMENENQIKISNWAVLPICRQNEDMKSSVLSQVRRRKLSREQEMFLFLNLL